MIVPTFEAIEQPVKIEMRELDSGHQAIPLHVIEPVGVELTGDNGSVEILGNFLFQQRADVLRQHFVHFSQHLVDLGFALDDLRAPIFMAF